MALTECHECGQEISRSARVCTGCGAPLKKGNSGRVAILGGILLAVVSVALYSPGDLKASPNTYPIRPAASARYDAISFYKQVTSQTASCDYAGGVRAITMLGGDPVAVYQAAKDEDSSCLNVDDALEKLPIPQSLGRPVAIEFQKAVARCQSAYLSQWSSAHSLQRALDDGKIGDIATYRESQANMLVEHSGCSNGLISAAVPLGVTPADLNAGEKRTSAGVQASPPLAKNVMDNAPATAPAHEFKPATTSTLTEYNFSDFPVEPYSGPSISPSFSGKQRPYLQYSTMIAQAVKRGPVFAGSVAIAEFGCGADCGMGYAIDLKNGSVTDLPVGGDATLDLVTEYQPASRLLKAAWKGGSSNLACAGFAYFEWTGHDFRTLRRSAPSPAECH